jgi:hypothetical protein
LKIVRINDKRQNEDFVALPLDLAADTEFEFEFSKLHYFENFVISTFRNYVWIVMNPISGFAVRLGVTLLFTVFEHKLFFFCSLAWSRYSSSSTLPAHIALWVVILQLHTTSGSCGLPGTDLEPHCAHIHIQTMHESDVK